VPGCVYGALARLEAHALIEPTDVGEQGRHRTIRITDAGRRTLRAELEQMARVAEAGPASGSTPPSGPASCGCTRVTGPKPPQARRLESLPPPSA